MIGIALPHRAKLSRTPPRLTQPGHAVVGLVLPDLDLPHLALPHLATPCLALPRESLGRNLDLEAVEPPEYRLIRNADRAVCGRVQLLGYGLSP